jgi:hypothetical protein
MLLEGKPLKPPSTKAGSGGQPIEDDSSILKVLITILKIIILIGLFVVIFYLAVALH